MISREIINEALNKAASYPYITRAGIFGSHARGDATPQSDVDVLIDYDSSSDEFMDDLGNFMEEVEKIIQVKVEFVTVPGLMGSKNNWFRQEVLKDVKWIYRK